MPRVKRIAAIMIVLVSMGCMSPTQPIPSEPSRTEVPRSESQLLESSEDRVSDEPASGTFRQDAFVITVHGLRLGPDYFVQATYDLDPGNTWPAGWAEGMDYYTSIDGRIWQGDESTGVAALKDGGNGFTYSVPLSAMGNPTGPITYAVIVGSYSGSFFFRAFGRADCRQCTKNGTQKARS